MCAVLSALVVAQRVNKDTNSRLNEQRKRVSGSYSRPAPRWRQICAALSALVVWRVALSLARTHAQERTQAHTHRRQICAVLSALVVAQDYRQGQALVADHSYKAPGPPRCAPTPSPRIVIATSESAERADSTRRLATIRLRRAVARFAYRRRRRAAERHRRALLARGRASALDITPRRRRRGRKARGDAKAHRRVLSVSNAIASHRTCRRHHRVTSETANGIASRPVSNEAASHPKHAVGGGARSSSLD